MPNKKQKLELTWIGKDEQPVLEPRILIEDPDKSYGDKNTENMLIYGDNLLALKALEQDFAGKIKCIYIDPPFNTGAAFENYDDGLEHSIWLNLMKSRIAILYNLLMNEGSLFIHLDDNEIDYCKVILDEIFKRDNFINRITIDARSPSAFSTVNPGVFKASEYLLWYSKDKKFFVNRSSRIPSQRNKAYNKFIKNRVSNESNWQFVSVKISFLEYWNKDRLDYILTFLNDCFKERDSFSKKTFTEYYYNNFKYASITRIPLVPNYLFGKFSLKTLNEFLQYSYPYLLEKCTITYSPDDVDEFVLKNADSVIRETEISDTGAGADIVKIKHESIKYPDKIFKVERDKELETIFIKNGKQISFYDKNVREIENQLTATELLTNIWTDISWEGIAKEGNVKFRKGKKPEKLIKRCIELATNIDDYVLDSFLGSGTTSAVAHKMRRKWIGIELGEHCDTHCLPRLKSIINGIDNSGITESVKWSKGGGLKYYYLGKSLLNKDEFGNWVISKEYNAQMLAAAMAKNEGFKYYPDENLYWKQGQSTEKDFIFTTTGFITVEQLDLIHEQMKEDESLLICCKSFSKESANRFSNITIKKIPQMLLGRCEFGREDYSLNIINVPTLNEEIIQSEGNINDITSEITQEELFEGGDDE